MKYAGLFMMLVLGIVAVAALSAAIIIIHHFTDSEFLLGVLGLAVAIVTASFQYKSAKDNETNARLFTAKQKVYTDLVTTLMGLFHERKANPTPAEQADLVRKLQSIRTELLVWGSSQTISALDRMGELPVDPKQTAAVGTRWLSTLFEAIRNDLGHRDGPGDADEMAIGMLIPADRPAMRQMLAQRG